MKQTDFRDVPDALWERIEPLLAHSSGKEVPTASLFLNVRFWEESSINAGVERTCAWLKFFRNLCRIFSEDR